MSDNAWNVTPLVILERVRCLECGTLYSKPVGGTTVDKNPGCPVCGYVGWLAASVPLTRALARHHSAEDQQQHRRALPG